MYISVISTRGPSPSQNESCGEFSPAQLTSTPAFIREHKSTELELAMAPVHLEPFILLYITKYEDLLVY